jgi:cysteine-rich repeat protein
MGQGFERFFNLKSNYSYRDTFFGTRSKHTKFAISNFFSFIQNNIIYHHHTQKAVHHVRKHHKKYIFWSAIWFLFVKVLVTLLTTVGWWTFAQETNNQYFIWDGIISQYEQCDDSNLQNLDGCDSIWQIESWAMCIWEPSICSITLDPIPNLVQTWDLVQTWNLEFSWNIIEIWILEPIPEIIQTWTFVSTWDILAIENKLSDFDNIDLINYFYGSWSEFTSNRQNNKCILGDLNIVRLQSWYNTIPNFLAANTLYLLESGSYDSKYMINVENDCTALIWLESWVVLHTTVIKWANIKISSWQNSIIYNLTLNW